MLSVAACRSIIRSKVSLLLIGYKQANPAPFEYLKPQTNIFLNFGAGSATNSETGIFTLLSNRTEIFSVLLLKSETFWIV